MSKFGSAAAKRPAAVGKDGFVLDSFLGATPPDEVKKIIPLTQSFETRSFRRALQLAFNYLQGEDITEAHFAAVAPNLEEVQLVFTGLFLILRAALRTKTSDDDVASDLLALKMPQKCVDDIVALLRSSRPLLVAKSELNKIGFPKLTGLRWRVDVTISTTQSLRVLKPSIIFQMSLSDGSIKTFESSVEKFGELRYCVAKVLKEMQEVERNPLFKVIEQENKRLGGKK